MIRINDISLEIDIKYKNIKNIYLRLKDDTIMVTAPHLTSLNTINNFIKSKESWIYKHYQNNQPDQLFYSKLYLVLQLKF